MKPIILTLILGLAHIICLAQDYQNKTALVIGNSSYKSAPLRNPVNDAIAMAKTLREVGFEVISYTDVSRSQLRSAIVEFGDALKKNEGVGLFYYSGHGLQYDGNNYLVPVDANIERAFEIEDECIKASIVLRMMEEYDNPMNIVILDACRNNPYVRGTKGAGGGLTAPYTAPVGSLIAFATAPGSVASDGMGENGLYTSKLIEAIKTPGLSIEQVFKKVRNEVIAVRSEQTPWENSSLRGDFYFSGRPSDQSDHPHPDEDETSLPDLGPRPPVAERSPYDMLFDKIVEEYPITYMYEEELFNFVENNPNHPNANYLAGIVSQETRGDCSSARRYLHKAEELIDSTEISKNVKYYEGRFRRRDLRTGIFMVRRWDVLLDIEKRIELCEIAEKPVLNPRRITGKVTDFGGRNPIVGAAVTVMNGGGGWITDVRGNYWLDGVGDDSVLIFNLKGYRTHMVQVGQGNVVNARLSKQAP